MIVVVGTPAWRAAEPAGPAGPACAIAVAAAARGAAVELVGRAGDDAAGDALMIALARAGVGHVALLRDPARPTPVVDPLEDGEALSPLDDLDEAERSLDGAVGTAITGPVAAAPRLEPADIDLGLRYLTSFRVVVVTDDVAAIAVPVAADATSYAGAHLIVLIGAGSSPQLGLPDTATVLEAPTVDAEGAFAVLVGAYAAAIDGGALPAEAFKLAVAERGATALR